MMRALPAGTVICDEFGRAVAQVRRDIVPGTMLQRDHFAFADGHVPVRGELLPPCISNLLRGVFA